MRLQGKARFTLASLALLGALPLYTAHAADTAALPAPAAQAHVLGYAGTQQPTAGTKVIFLTRPVKAVGKPVVHSGTTQGNRPHYKGFAQGEIR